MSAPRDLPEKVRTCGEDRKGLCTWLNVFLGRRVGEESEVLYSGEFQAGAEVVLRGMVSVAPSVPLASRPGWVAEEVDGRCCKDYGLRSGISPEEEEISKHDGH